MFLQALCFGEDPHELSSVSAAKLALDAEEETDILVKSHRSGLNSSINQTLVQRHWNLNLSMCTQTSQFDLFQSSFHPEWFELPPMGYADVAASLSLYLAPNLWNKSSAWTNLHLQCSHNPNRDSPLLSHACPRPPCGCFWGCWLADQFPCSIYAFLSRGWAEWHPEVSGGDVQSHPVPSLI